MDKAKYRITLKEIGYEENRGVRNDCSPVPDCLNKTYRILTNAGERTLWVAMDMREDKLAIHLYNMDSGQYINAELVDNLREIKTVIDMARSDGVQIVYGN